MNKFFESKKGIAVIAVAVVVVVLLGLCMAALKLSPLAVLGGFVMGQAAFLAARLFLNRLNKF